MNKLLSVVLASLLLAAPIANADRGFSAGVSSGYATIEVDDAGETFDGSGVGWKVFGQYMFNENWGVEGGYIDFGEVDDDILDANVKLDANGFDLFVVGAAEVSQDFDLFGKVGFIAWEADASIEGFTGSEDGTDLALGIGGAYRVTDQVAIRGEWEWFDIEDSDAVWMLSIGAQVRFE